MEWYIPVMIFCARICDVSIGTMRMMLVVGGHRWISALLGFFEVIIWIFAAGFAIRYLDEPIAIIAYAGGFSSGVLIGMLIESRLAFGLRMVRIISTDAGVHVADRLRDAGFRVTRVEGSGRTGAVEISFLVIRRRALDEVRRLVMSIAPDAFVTVERVDRASGELEPRSLRRPGFMSKGLVRK